VIWPIIDPLIPKEDIANTTVEEITKQLKEGIWKIFFQTLQLDQNKKEEEAIVTELKKLANENIINFVLELIKDFSYSFHEDFTEDVKPEEVIESLEQFISQQVIIEWVDYLVEFSIAPLLILSLKEPYKIEKGKEMITRVFLAIIQGLLEKEEAETQLRTLLTNELQLAEEPIRFVSAMARTIARANETIGLKGLATIAEETLERKKETTRRKYTNVRQATKEIIFDREKVIEEWEKNVLQPATIGLRIAGEEQYKRFITSCKKNFELFLDQLLSASDFEKRVDKELRKFGGKEEELMQPIRESIVSSVRFLELARIDDPSLSLLMMIIDDEREGTKRNCT